MYKVYRAYSPFNVILHIFNFFTCGKNKNCYVAMVNPFTLKIITTKKDLLIGTKIYKHELRHIEQIKKNGRFKFICKYLWYNIRYGYYKNPYEVEARSKETE